MPVKTVWKYPLELAEHSVIAMPEGAVPRYVALQGNMPFIWMEVEPSRKAVARHVFIVGTGQYIPQGKTYVGSVQTTGVVYVWHVYIEEE